MFTYFGYNSVDREPISMKSGLLWISCRGLALADFGCELCNSESWRAWRRKCFLQTTQCAISDFQLAKFHNTLYTTCWSVLPSVLSVQNFENFSLMGRFPRKEKCNFFPCLVTSNFTKNRHQCLNLQQTLHESSIVVVALKLPLTNLQHGSRFGESG